MKTKHFLIIVLAFLLNSVDAKAQTQFEMNQSAYEDYKKADAELNKVYKQLMVTLNARQKKLLVTAQKNWIKFRDSDCESVSGQYEGGSMRPMVHSMCLTNRTEARTAQLKARLEEDK